MAWKDFTETSVYTNLVEKSKHPHELRDGEGISCERVRQYICRTEYFDLLYFAQRVDDSVLDLLASLAIECGLVEQFKQMRRGRVINEIEGFESEQRKVLHTACRDLFSQKPMEKKATAQAKKELEKLKGFLKDVDSGKICNQAGNTFHTMIHVGIGGSDLGPRAVYEALRPFGIEGREVYFVSNVDPDDGAAVLGRVDLSRTLVNIVSKSGTTLETLANEKYVVDALVRAGLDPAKHCLSVTGEGSPMDNPASYLQSFYMFDYIGGRYSVTSMVGAVMLGFYMGYEHLMGFLKGAANSDNEAENEEVRENLPLLLALLGIWNHNFLKYSSVAVLPYSQALHRFPAHLQQCDMESNGKSINKKGEFLSYQTGPLVWGEPGTNGQHAFYQLLHQGTEIVPVEFIGFMESQHQSDIEVEMTTSQEKLLANLLAQSLAMASGDDNTNPNKVFQGNRPNSIIMGKRLTPYSMGALLAIYEAKIVFQGFAWGINSFDQEGVQLGKVLANRILALMRGEDTTDGVEKVLLETVKNK